MGEFKRFGISSISTHTLTWSVTVTPSYVAVTSAISTHTLTWSVTPLRSAWLLAHLHFNSHAHVERDKLLPLFRSQLLHFNSHAHVERDYCFSTLALYHANFNSHAHVERDDDLFKKLDNLEISTHTLTWSVTCYRRCKKQKGDHFNSHAHVERDAACS